MDPPIWTPTYSGRLGDQKFSKLYGQLLDLSVKKINIKSRCGFGRPFLDRNSVKQSKFESNHGGESDDSWKNEECDYDEISDNNCSSSEEIDYYDENSWKSKEYEEIENWLLGLYSNLFENNESNEIEQSGFGSDDGEESDHNNLRNVESDEGNENIEIENNYEEISDDNSSSTEEDADPFTDGLWMSMYLVSNFMCDQDLPVKNMEKFRKLVLEIWTHILDHPRVTKYGLNQNKEFLEFIKRETEQLNDGKTFEELDLYEKRCLIEHTALRNFFTNHSIRFFSRKSCRQVT